MLRYLTNYNCDDTLIKYNRSNFSIDIHIYKGWQLHFLRKVISNLAFAGGLDHKQAA